MEQPYSESPQTPPQRKRRKVTLTQDQIESGLGAELLSICQSITEDGRISDQEVTELNEWLDANRDENLPALNLLSPLVTDILKDGVVTEAERKALYSAIERVLPSDLRTLASLARKRAQEEDREEKRLRKEEERAERATARERDRCIDSYDFMLAGAKRPEYSRLIERHVHEGDEIKLAREPGNGHDRNAIRALTLGGHHVGYVPREDAETLAPYLDEKKLYHAWVKKIIGYNYAIPVIVVDVYRQDADGDELRTAEVVSTAKGCLGVVVGFLVISSLVALQLVLA